MRPEPMRSPPYAPLPHPLNDAGETRTVGLELEFGGLTAADAAAVLERWSGSSAEARDPHSFTVEHARLGELQIYLDMASAHPKGGSDETDLDRTLRGVLGDTAQAVVPVEIVTAPLAPDHLPDLDPLVRALRAAGAVGTQSSIFYAHGMHLNVEVRALSAERIAPVLRAFLLLEDWMREKMEIDLTRRTFAFVNPFPSAYVDRAAQDDFGADTDRLIGDYLAHNPTRNRSLDMTPVFAMIDRARVEAALRGEKLKPRPTFHYRLPDCSIDQEGWTPAGDWNLWVALERISERADIVAELARAWIAYRESWLTQRADWRRESAAILEAHGVTDARSAIAGLGA